MSNNYSLDFSQDIGSYGLGADYNAPADGCTLCGLCISSCPTYQLESDIRQSPMGRIQIMRNIEAENYNYSIDDYVALDSCLVCRNCEDICPSKVPYSEMLDSAKQSLYIYRNQSFLIRVLMDLAEHPLLLKLFVFMAKPFQQWAKFLLPRVNSPLIKASLSGFSYLKYAKFKQFKASTPVLHNANYKKVSLFTGCMSSIFESNVHQATIKLLQHCGVEVHIPKQQTCCGAIHAHNGNQRKAEELATKNINSFNIDSDEPILSTSSGCGEYLLKYNDLLRDDAHCISNNAMKFSESVSDVSSYLFISGVLDDVKFLSSNKTIAIHSPCSMRYSTKSVDAVRSLLQLIPGLMIVDLTDKIACCGAGGSHMLTHPDASKEIRNKTIDEIEKLKPDILITSNLSCAVHLKEGFSENLNDIEVLHPVELIERQLSRKRSNYEFTD